MPLLLQLWIFFTQTFCECSLRQSPQKLLLGIFKFEFKVFFLKIENLTLWPMGKRKNANILEMGHRRAQQWNLGLG